MNPEEAQHKFIELKRQSPNYNYGQLLTMLLIEVLIGFWADWRKEIAK